MKENYWIRERQLETEADNFNQHGKQALKGNQQHHHRQQVKKQQQQQQRQQHAKQQDDENWRKPTVKSSPSENNGKNNNMNESNNNNTIGNRQGDGFDEKTSAYSNDESARGDKSRSNPGDNNLERQRGKTKQQQQQQQQIKKDEGAVNLSFCGCGFLGIYHVGVASCFHEYAPQLSMQKISGSSVGGLVAAAYICGNLQLAYATTDILRVAIDARARALGPFHPSFDVNAIVREALERGLPDDVHLRASGKLHVSLTRVYDGENVIVSEFESKEDVIQALICSCFIPFWSGLVAPKYKGISYMDGGFSNNLVTLDNKTVTVSPFAGEADICPKDDVLGLLQVSICNTSFSLTPNNLYRLSHALLPPPPEVLSDLCEQGFADGIRFLQQMKLISCTKCLEIRSSLLVTTNGEDMEEAFTQQVNQTTHQNNLEQSRMNSTASKATATFASVNNDNLLNHIRLEQQEQKMIEITGNQTRRNSVVSTSSQIYQQQQQQQQHVATSYDQQSHCVLLSDNDEEDEDEEEQYDGDDDGDRHNNCDECVLIRQKALCDPLPKLFSDRISDACDTVNKSLSNWIYSHRPIKYLSYLAAPYYLPIDISLALIYRCWQKLPFIRSELISCVSQIVDFLIEIIKRMNSTKSTSTLLMGGCASRWESDAIEYEKEMIKHQERIRSARNSTTCCPNISSLLTSSATTATTTVKLTNEGVCLSKLCRKSSSSTNQHLHSLEDTFDSIVDVTSNQEARIFAYYFRDAKNRLQVTEIFDLQRAAELSNNNNNNNDNHTDLVDPHQAHQSQQHTTLLNQQQPPHYNTHHRHHASILAATTGE